MLKPSFLSKSSSFFGTENAVVRGYTKVTLATCVHTKALLAADTADSRTADVKRLEPVVNKLASSGKTPEYVLADKGYDAEYAHRMIRERLGSTAMIPVKYSEPGKAGSPRMRTRGFYRGLMKYSFDKTLYGMRSISETANSMVKGVLGEVLDGRDPEARHSEMMFRCIAHNFRIGMKLKNSGMFV